MLIETIQKTIKSHISKENKRKFLIKEVPLFIDELFVQKDYKTLEKLFLTLQSLPYELNKKHEIDYLFSAQLFKQIDVETFNKVLKNKKILEYFEDNADILSYGIFNGDIKNVFSFFKRLKYPIFFAECDIYQYQHLFPIQNVKNLYKELYNILKYSSGEEPLYLPYHIINNAIKQKNVMLLEIGFSFLTNNTDLKKVFEPILWNIYSSLNLEDLIFLETNEDLLKEIKVCNADFLCEFLDENLTQTTEKLKFFSYSLQRSQEHNKETVIMILTQLKNIPLHSQYFEFIFIFYNYLKSSKNGRLYVLEELIRDNGVIELIEIIKD